jgi:hypothetical protein
MIGADLRGSSGAALAALMREGRAFDPGAVAGWQYRGISLGLPAWIERLSWVKFAKAFGTDGRGWNIRIEQDGLDRPWRPRLRRGSPVTFGRFKVHTGPRGVVLDYSVDRVLRLLRDPIVALDDRADLLLGRSLLALGPASVPTPSYFVLERDRLL